MDWKKIWKKTYRTMLQALLPFIPINLGMLQDFDIKVIAVEVLGAGLTCFIMALLDSDNTTTEEDATEE